MSLPKQLLESKLITDEQWKEYQELKEVVEEYKQISITHYNRPYAKRYLKEAKKRYKKETGRNLLYPDSEEIYKDYYNQKEEIERLNNIINELEKDINKRIERYDVDETINGIVIGTLKYVLDKLQELKGDDK